ncbi:MAG: Lon protease family protein, partial [Alphaproteobacteria bacterium]
RFGIGMARDGYNLFALGPTGLRKHTVVRRILEGKGAQEPVPDDLCYVNNVADPQKPRALRLPVGTAAKLRDDMAHLVQDLRAAIPAAFEGDDYRSRKETLEEDVKQRHEKVIEEIQERAREHGIALIRTPAGLGFAPMREGEVISPEVFESLPEDERRRLEHDVETLQAELQAVMRELPSLVKEGRRRLRELNRDVTRFAVGHLIDELRERYRDIDAVLAYLDAVREDVIDNADTFLVAEEGAQATAAPAPGPQTATPTFDRYKVNVLVDHSDAKGAPIVYEDHPTYQRLMGEVEHVAQMGALVTDFNLIKPGALHRANGGHLILDARKLVQQPYAYEGLKQALRARCIRIESLGQALSLVSTRSLEPQPVPLEVKIVLIGDGMLYYLLSQLDPEFGEHFKVAADFDDRVERSEDNTMLYARLIAGVAKESKLKPLDRGAVARALEHGARLAGDAERLSVRVESIADLLREADYWSGEAGKEVTGAEDVQRAIDAQTRRANRLQERMEEEIQRGTILIDTAGAKVGQVNGLSVNQLGSYAFGRPSRITARARMGKGEVIDIEREVALGGPLHSKGVLILSGFLGARFGAERPLSLSASLVFEQSYGGVDGDSASSAELYALLSALSGVPIRQSLAVTGSVNQQGEVQAIGGANEKIEGFFDICEGRGLGGEQGVLIPASNVKHLMLRADVVEAARRGAFRIYPIETIDQGIECLTGVPAGERDAEGRYPEGTINHRVDARLTEFAEKLRAFAAREGPEGKR